MKIKISATLDTGKERDNNEDALTYCPDLTTSQWQEAESMPAYIPIGEYGAVTVVADGMGGANAGEVASAIAINTVKEIFVPDRIKDIVNDEEQIHTLLHDVVKTADERIVNKMNTDPETAGMGTTIVICWIVKDKAHIAWCGDSRCYVYHPAHGLKALSKDHSLVQELVDNGEITHEEAFSHPDSNIITRGLGDFDTKAVPDIVVHNISHNEMLLLCSDGLVGYCQESEIEALLANSYQDVDLCSQQLLKMALDAGGYDNISIIAASLIDDDQEMPSAPSLLEKIKHFFGIS